MATFKVVVRKKRADGFYPWSHRLTKVKRYVHFCETFSSPW